MISLDVKDRGVLDSLARLSRGLKDMTPVMADVAQVLASESERQFASESGPHGSWPALAPSTTAARTKKGTWPGQMLQVSAAGLAASVQTDHGYNFASIGSNKVYAAIQLLGGQAGRNHAVEIPARTYLPFDPETQDISEAAGRTVLDVLQAHLDRMVG